MNEDALAAVVAAATLLLGVDDEPSQHGPCTRWNITARLRGSDATRTALVAPGPSNWTLSGRLHG